MAAEVLIADKAYDPMSVLSNLWREPGNPP
jgi:hypothetical protein